MDGEAPQDFGPLEPVLVHLGGELDEVGRDVRAGNQRIGDIGKHSVQSMAEFVKQRLRLIETQERRCAIRAFARLRTLTMIGSTTPSSFSCFRRALIQAPLRFDGLAK